MLLGHWVRCDNNRLRLQTRDRKKQLLCKYAVLKIGTILYEDEPTQKKNNNNYIVVTREKSPRTGNNEQNEGEQKWIDTITITDHFGLW